MFIKDANVSEYKENNENNLLDYSILTKRLKKDNQINQTHTESISSPESSIAEPDINTPISKSVLDYFNKNPSTETENQFSESTKDISFTTPSKTSVLDYFPSSPTFDRNKEVEWILQTDGASRGNPGMAGAGVYIENLIKKKNYKYHYFLGYKCTNTIAEYIALKYGLERLREILEKENPSNSTSSSLFIITVDSLLLSKQINGDYKLKANHLKTYFNDIQKLLSYWNPKPQIIHVPRSFNSEADKLANKGIDSYIGEKNKVKNK